MRIFFREQVFIIYSKSSRVQNTQLRVFRKSELSVLVLCQHGHYVCHKTQKISLNIIRKMFILFQKKNQLVEIKNNMVF